MHLLDLVLGMGGDAFEDVEIPLDVVPPAARPGLPRRPARRARQAAPGTPRSRTWQIAP
jgi:hypothetical protein